MAFEPTGESDKVGREKPKCKDRHCSHPNILILCMDQWDTYMKIPLGGSVPSHAAASKLRE
jgi:hypothetical protein